MSEKMVENQNIEKVETEKLLHVSGRESMAIIDRKDKIGKGGYGDIYRADVSLVSDEDKIRELKKQYVLKEFRDVNYGYEYDGVPADKSNAEKALMKYEAIKNAGIETWPTFRRIEDRNAVIMTDGEGNENFLVSTSDASKSKNTLLQKQYEVIENLKEVVQLAIGEALSAGSTGIFLSSDSWFASFVDIPEPKKIFAKFRKPKNSGELEKVFVGDFDNVKIGMLEKYSTSNIQMYNLIHLNDFFNELFVQVSHYDSFWKYKKIANKTIQNEAIKIDKDRWKKYLNMPAGKMDEYDPGKDHIIFRE